MKEEYKSVCDSCYQKTWYETEQPCKNTIFKGCKTYGSHQIINKPKQCKGTLRLIDNSLLDDRFEPFYDNGQRIEVTYKWGEKERFYVGKSTGWKPIYLAIKKRNSNGGGGISCDAITSIQPLSLYR